MQTGSLNACRFKVGIFSAWPSASTFATSFHQFPLLAYARNLPPPRHLVATVLFWQHPQHQKLLTLSGGLSWATWILFLRSNSKRNLSLSLRYRQTNGAVNNDTTTPFPYNLPHLTKHAVQSIWTISFYVHSKFIHSFIHSNPFTFVLFAISLNWNAACKANCFELMNLLQDTYSRSFGWSSSRSQVVKKAIFSPVLRIRA